MHYNLCIIIIIIYYYNLKALLSTVIASRISCYKYILLYISSYMHALHYMTYS